MKMKKVLRCPGCGKHCCEHAPRCKYGCKYFAKQNLEAPKHKWERHVQRDGLLWRMLRLSRRVKKLLRSGRLSEQEMLALLDADRQNELSAALAALENCLKPWENCKL